MEPNHSASARLVRSPMHTWGQPRMNLSCLSPRALSQDKRNPQTCARPSWWHEKRTQNASGCVLTFRPSTALSNVSDSSPHLQQSQLLTLKLNTSQSLMPLRVTINAISEHYDRRMYEAFQGLQDFRRVVDDVIIFDEDLASHISHVRQFLQRCEERGISLGADKFQFCQTKVEFAGFRLSPIASVMTSLRPLVAFPLLSAELTSGLSLVWSIS